MTSQQILSADVLDILFENRNKAYGAYALRRHYPKEMVKALTCSFALALLLLLFSTGSSEKNQAMNNDPLVGVTLVDVQPIEPTPPVTPPPPAKPQEPVLQRNFTNRIDIVDKEIPSMTSMDELKNAMVSNIDMEGPAVKDWQPPQEPATPAATTGSGNEEKPKPDVPLITRSPEFPGGMKAWTAFLNRHLQSPQNLEEGEKKTVIVRFHVAEDGTVTAFQVAQSAGAEFDNEVIRVLKKMPRWMPALQQGQAISVSFAQQVSFVGGGE